MNTQLSLFCAIVVCVCHFSSYGAEDAPIAQASVESSKTTPSARHSRYDDLEWLIGKWWCVEKQWLDPSKKLSGSHDEHLLEWLNVYYPYSDDHLKLELTPDPDDRPIAAEFIIRADPDDFYTRKGLFSMLPRSAVRIGTDTIRVGEDFDRFEFRYALVKESGRLRLELQSKHMRLVMERITENAGDIKDSAVVAPIKTYSSADIINLRERYKKLQKPRESNAPSK